MILGVYCAAGMSAMNCNQSSNDEHRHSFSSEWSFDNDNHWKACTGKNCEEVDSLSAHEREGKICTVCGHEEGAIKAKPSNAVSVINSASDGTTVKLERGAYGILSIAPVGKNLKLEFAENSSATSITIGGQVTNLTIEGVKVTEYISINDRFDGLTIKDCKFSGNFEINNTNYNGEEFNKDFVIEGCTFTNIASTQNKTAIKMKAVENLTLKDNIFNGVQYNCYQAPGGKIPSADNPNGVPSLKGDIVITGNTFKDVGYSVLNLNRVHASSCDISNNVFYLNTICYIDIEVDEGADINVYGVVIGVNTWEEIPEGNQDNFNFWDTGAYTYDPTEQILLEAE